MALILTRTREFIHQEQKKQKSHGGTRQGSGRRSEDWSRKQAKPGSNAVAHNKKKIQRKREKQRKFRESMEPDLKDLRCKSGQLKSVDAVKLLLVFIMIQVTQFDQMITFAILYCAKTHGLSERYIWNVWKSWIEGKKVYNSRPNGGKGSNKSSWANFIKIPREDYPTIDRLLQTHVVDTGIAISAYSLQDCLATYYFTDFTPTDEHPHPISERHCRRLLRELEYKYGKKKRVYQYTPARVKLHDQFIMDYAEARAEEAKGNAVLVFTDESYIHQHHARGYGWFHKDTTKSAQLPNSRGRMLILLHALTGSYLLFCTAWGGGSRSYYFAYLLTR